ncbi:MAG TPA: ABC transporter permease [Verrucomicrobiota bacterium]|nr:ABC transporter permease [Verrucomicrobiota bacterium]HNU52330.1 ABC transporter permease [Verrucomicrobiota bacterium]
MAPDVMQGPAGWRRVLVSAVPVSSTGTAGRWLLGWIETTHRLIAFALITLGVMVNKSRDALPVVRPLILAQIARCGVRLLPMVSFVAFALGFVVIGQTVALLSQVGATQWVGTVMVTAVIRELGPLTVAVVVLMRVGTATLIELGTTRALGEVEALEALGIDPIHYLVVPRVIGLSLAVLALTSYLIVGAVFSGYLFAFLQDVPLTPAEYLRQLVLAMSGADFVLVVLKSAGFGLIIAVVTSFQGLSRPLHLSQVSQVTTRALVASSVAIVLLDAGFIVIYLFL